MRKIGSTVLHKTEILPIQPSLRLHLQQKEKKPIKLFGFQMELILQESAISVTNVHNSILPQIPPWIIKKNTSNPPIKRIPQDKNTSQHLPGQISHYPHSDH